MTYTIDKQDAVIPRRKKRAPIRRHSRGQELRQKAAALGLPTRKAIFPEGKLSPSYGDPTAVDDRPFARSRRVS
ncbi:MAG: hypothetical protein SVX43_18860 [Cyanobacteriota bacterium]|nr:hypothetical protein [Cyanobacteriota bacterium]